MRSEIRVFRTDYDLPFVVDTLHLARHARNCVYLGSKGTCQIYFLFPSGLVKVCPGGTVSLQGLTCGRKDIDLETFVPYLPSIYRALTEGNREEAYRKRAVISTDPNSYDEAVDELARDYFLAEVAINKLLNLLCAVFPRTYGAAVMEKTGHTSLQEALASLPAIDKGDAKRNPLFSQNHLHMITFMAEKQIKFPPAPALHTHYIDLLYLEHNAEILFPLYPMEISLSASESSQEVTEWNLTTQRRIAAHPCVVESSVRFDESTRTVHLRARPLLHTVRKRFSGGTITPSVAIRMAGLVDDITCHRRKAMADYGIGEEEIVLEEDHGGYGDEREVSLIASSTVCIYSTGGTLWRATSHRSLRDSMSYLLPKLQRAARTRAVDP